MSNIATSTQTPNTSINDKVKAAYPTFLTALQDMATFYGLEIKGVYTKKGGNAQPMNGEQYRGSFNVQP